MRTFVWSPVYVDELVSYTTSAGTFYTHQDARCDVVAITDAAGFVRERVRYDDFGEAEVRSWTGEVLGESAVGNVYGFQGRRADPETGLLYFRARYYDPEVGRFLQRDPVWDAGNVGGQYTFCGNGPVTGRDPGGTQAAFFGDSMQEMYNRGAQNQASSEPEGPSWYEVIKDAVLDDFRTMDRGLEAAKNEFQSGSAAVGTVEVIGVAFMAADIVLSVVTGGAKECPKQAAEELLKKAAKEALEHEARERLAREAAERLARERGPEYYVVDTMP